MARVLPGNADRSPARERPRTPGIGMRHDAEYDYVLVGAGSAGCVLANRLSADPARSVLLLEAGTPDRHRAITTPIAFSNLFKSPFDWAYTTTGQPGLLGRRVYLPPG